MIEGTGPFAGYRVYGPYLSKTTGRRLVALVSTDHRTSMSYARYLVCMREGRWLDGWEQADHIDEDKTNDDDGNLQVLSRPDNIRKSIKPMKMATLTCPVCQTVFERPQHRVSHKVKPPCCSRRCGGLRGRSSDG